MSAGDVGRMAIVATCVALEFMRSPDGGRPYVLLSAHGDDVDQRWRRVTASPIMAAVILIRALVTGAGTGSSGNVIRALRSMTPRPFVVGLHHDRFTLKQSLADVSYLSPPYETNAFVDAALEIVGRERINVVMTNDDSAVRAFSQHRRRFPLSLFLPRQKTIALCQDKYLLTAFLRQRKIPAPPTYAVRSLRDLEGIFARFPKGAMLWCRARRGSRSLAGTPVASVAQARAWITQWRDLRGIDVSDFILADYLPGRHIVVYSLWRDGRPLFVRAAEVLSYFAASNNPSGVFSLPSLAKTVVEPEALDVNARALKAIEPRVSGAFIVELKAAANDRLCVTEINAGRFPSGATALLAVGRHNMIAMFARCAVGESVASADADDASAEHYLVRDIDTAPGVYSAKELLEGYRTLEPERS